MSLINPPKIPASVLVVIYALDGEVLLLERADRPDFWQSVTGSLETLDESPVLAAQREVFEETGIQAPIEQFSATGVVTEYDIFPEWRHRYAAGVTRNIETGFTLCVDKNSRITLSPREHLQSQWLSPERAAARCFSPSNAMAIRILKGAVR